jgi:hypothetical protein
MITKGATDQSVTLYIVDNTTGLPVTSLAYNSSGIDLWYRREGAAVTSITEATQTASGAHSDGGFVHLANGVYRLDLPDAAVASGVDSVVVGGTLTGYTVYPVTVQLTGMDLQTASTAQTGDSYAIVNSGTFGNSALKSLIDAIDDFVDTEVAAIKAKTDNIPADPADQSDIIAATDALASAISALNDISAAEVNAEVLDVLNTDTFSQPGQGTPAATTTLATMIRYLYKAWRNKKTQTATEYALFNDDATTVDQKATVGESGGTTTIGEIATGP